MIFTLFVSRFVKRKIVVRSLMTTPPPPPLEQWLRFSKFWQRTFIWTWHRLFIFFSFTLSVGVMTMSICPWFLVFNDEDIWTLCDTGFGSVSWGLGLTNEYCQDGKTLGQILVRIMGLKWRPLREWSSSLGNNNFENAPSPPPPLDQVLRLLVLLSFLPWTVTP